LVETFKSLSVLELDPLALHRRAVKEAADLTLADHPKSEVGGHVYVEQGTYRIRCTER